jgi:predicted dithiol-disulfide oxidoreductase (DUF899 family)
VSDIPVLDLPMSAEYRAQRERLLEAERQLRDQCERVAQLRRDLPPGPVVETDYTFHEGAPDLSLNASTTYRETKLSELFSPGKRELFIYHMMFDPTWDEGCRMCSMWLDGLNGVADHIREMANFAVIAKAELPKLRAWAEHRGWDKLRLLSSAGSSFNSDLRVEDADGEQMAGISVFTRSPVDGTIRLFYSGSPFFGMGEYRGMDLICPTWGVLDLLPGGRDSWMPSEGH